MEKRYLKTDREVLQALLDNKLVHCASPQVCQGLDDDGYLFGPHMIHFLRNGAELYVKEPRAGMTFIEAVKAMEEGAVCGNGYGRYRYRVQDGLIYGRGPDYDDEWMPCHLYRYEMESRWHEVEDATD